MSKNTDELITLRIEIQRLKEHQEVTRLKIRDLLQEIVELKDILSAVRAPKLAVTLQ